MSPTATLLDPEELLHLALLAAEENQHDKAISLLKQGLALTPEDARMLFLLGAQHAQIGLHARAIEEIARSVALDASVPAAHFELGLLHMMAGAGEQARGAWRPLGELGEDDPFRVFSGGLLRLLEEDLAGCIGELRRGLALCVGNAALAGSMQKILDSALVVQQGQGAGQAEGQQPEARQGEDAAEQGGHVFLSAYRNH